MRIPPASASRSPRPIRPPGVYIENRIPAGARTPDLMSGVPGFIGFADPEPNVLERGRVPAIVIDHWNAEKFRRSIKPGTGSFLPMVVRGFFANGGKRCIVLPVPPGSGTAGLLHLLRQGGPLEERTDIDLICLPDAASRRVQGGEHRDNGNDPYEIHARALEHCEVMGDRFAILDAQDVVAATPITVDEVLSRASNLRSAFGALYFPWIASDRARDTLRVAAPPIGNQEWRSLPQPKADGEHGPLEFGPPCGHVAGVFSRIDAHVGPQRSPANVRLEDVVDTSVHLSDQQHAELNEGGVNCLRSLRGRGIDVGGARTRSGHSAWTFVSTTRVILGFRRWLAVGMRDLVFEPQSTILWDRIRSRLLSQCFELLRSGALAGTDPAQAFFVKCDNETNPPEEADLGRVVAHVGLAPSVPAEFIVVRVEHDSSGMTTSSLPG